MTKVDENIQTAQNILSGIVERCYELEEENKKLREKIKYIRKLNTYDYNELQDLVITLEEKNKKLKEKVSELEDVSKDYDLLSKDFIALGEENKTLREELISRIRQPQNTPYGKGVTEFIEEDTLQELRDLGKI